MKTIYTSSLTVVIALLLFPAFHAMAQQDSDPEIDTIFPKGDKIGNDNFTGEAWVSLLVRGDSLNQTAGGNVIFEPGARTNWHSHPAG